MKDSVVSALRFYKAKDYEVAWIDASIDMSKAKTDTSAMMEIAGRLSKNKGRKVLLAPVWEKFSYLKYTCTLIFKRLDRL